MTLRVLVGRLGGLSAGQDRRPRRRRRRAARRRSRARASRCARSSPAIPACSTRCATPRPCTRSRICTAGPARLLAAHAAGLDLLVARRAASLRAARQSLSRPRRQGLARQRAALRGARRSAPRAIARGAVAGARARHRPRARLAGGPRPRPAALRRRAAAAHRDDRAQPLVPGPVSARAAGDARPAAARVRDRRRRVSRHDRLPEGRTRARRPHHHGVADLRRGDPHAGGRHGPRRAAAPARRRAAPAFSTASTRRSGTRPPTRISPRASTRSASRGAPRTRRRCRRASASTSSRARRSVRRRQPADLAEGHGPAARARCRRSTASGAQLALLGTGDKPLEDGFAAAASPPSRAASPRVIGYDEALAHLMQAGVDALLVPSRFEPCGLTQLCALRYGAIPVVARVGGLADTVDRRQRDGAGRRRRHRHPVRAGDARTPGARDRPRASRSGATARRGAACNRARWRPTSAGRRPAKRYAALFRDLAARRAA